MMRIRTTKDTKDTKGIVLGKRLCDLCVLCGSVTALLLVASACSPTKTEPVPATTRPVVLPDLSRMAAPVQEQMRELHASLTRKIESRAAPADLAEAYGEMGSVLLAAEYFDAAEPCFQNAQSLAPGDRRWPYFLGHAYRLRGAPADAGGAFARAVELAPTDVAALVWLGRVTLDQGNAAAADEWFAKAMAVDPQSVAAITGRGRAALALRDYAGAAGRFELALSLDPRASTVHYPLALAYRGLGQLERADREARQIGGVEVGPTDPLMQEIAAVLRSAASYEKVGLRALERRDWPAAVAAFRSAVDLAPESASAHHRLGTALSLTGDATGAVSELQEALSRSPEYVPALFSLGVIFASAGRLDEAVERLSAAVRYEPGNADARLQLAVALLRARRVQEAHVHVVEGARRHPQRPEFARLLQQFRPLK